MQLTRPKIAQLQDSREKADEIEIKGLRRAKTGHGEAIERVNLLRAELAEAHGQAHKGKCIRERRDC